MDKKNKRPVKKPRKKVFIENGVWTTVKRDQPERPTCSVIVKNITVKGVKKPKPPQTRPSMRIREYMKFMKEVENRLNKQLNEMEKEKKKKH